MKHVRNGAILILLLAGGLFTLHYTQADGWNHHTEWAQLHGMPPPSFAIYAGGLVATLLGAGYAGFLLGRARGRSR